MFSTKKKEKKKTPTWLLAVIIIAMMAVFVIQMLFPTNLGKLISKTSPDISEITVSITNTDDGDETGSYHTESPDEITDFIKWADTQKMKNTSLTNNLNYNVKHANKYNFALTAADGTLSAVVIDTEGYIHCDAELYKIIDNEEEFINSLRSQLDAWQQE